MPAGNLSNDMYARSSGNLTYEHWYQEAVTSKGIFKVIGHPKDRNVTNHADYKDSEVISAVRAILDPQTQAVLGVVLIDLKLRVIAETAQDVRLGKSGWLMVVDDQGNPIYVPKLLDIPAISPQWLQDRPIGEFEKTVNGRPLQFIFRASSFTNWTTIGVFSMEEAVPEVREILRLYIGTFVFIVCILGITASFFSFRIASRVRFNDSNRSCSERNPGT